MRLRVLLARIAPGYVRKASEFTDISGMKLGNRAPHLRLENHLNTRRLDLLDAGSYRANNVRAGTHCAPIVHTFMDWCLNNTQIPSVMHLPCPLVASSGYTPCVAI